MNNWYGECRLDGHFSVGIYEMLGGTGGFSWGNHKKFTKGIRHFHKMAETHDPRAPTHVVLVEGPGENKEPMIFMDDVIHGSWLLLEYGYGGIQYVHCEDCAASLCAWIISNQSNWWQNFGGVNINAASRLYQ